MAFTDYKSMDEVTAKHPIRSGDEQASASVSAADPVQLAGVLKHIFGECERHTANVCNK